MTASNARRSAEEAPLEPTLEIIDPHLHFWEIPGTPDNRQITQRFLLPEALETVGRSGHNVTRTVFVECHAMYRAEGPEVLRPVGETEFVNGIAAMSASGNYGPCRYAAGIVGSVDLLLGGQIAPVLEAHVTAGGGRFRGIRFATAYSEAGMFGGSCDPARKSLMMNGKFREGVSLLAGMGLSLDVWCFHTQLEELIDLASAFPDLTIVLDHVGTPETLGVYADKPDQAYAEWKPALVELARRPNVVVKLGGLGMDLSAPIGSFQRNATSEVLAEEWRRVINTCIDAFTPERCMFEGNFTPDSAAGTYGAVWNAFKRIAAGYSPQEKTALFSGTARRVYRLS